MQDPIDEPFINFTKGFVCWPNKRLITLRRNAFDCLELYTVAFNFFREKQMKNFQFLPHGYQCVTHNLKPLFGYVFERYFELLKLDKGWYKVASHLRLLVLFLLICLLCLLASLTTKVRYQCQWSYRLRINAA